MKENRAAKPILILSLLAILCVGVIGAFRMAESAPTYDGSRTDVEALQQDSGAYDNSAADGAAAVMVNENREKTAADNVVYSVVFNYRGYDTLGESFILIGAIAGTTAILRRKGNRASAAFAGTDSGKESGVVRVVDYRGGRGKKQSGSRRYQSKSSRESVGQERGSDEIIGSAAAPRRIYRRKHIIVKCAADGLLPFAVVYGWYIILHGAMSPGGGFQGGVLVAGAVLLVYLGYGLPGIRKLFHTGFLHNSETLAEIAYVCVALAGIIAGFTFCYNFVFPVGREESAMLMNDAVGYHVMAGISCLLILMLEALDRDRGGAQQISEAPGGTVPLNTPQTVPFGTDSGKNEMQERKNARTGNAGKEEAE